MRPRPSSTCLHSPAGIRYGGSPVTSEGGGAWPRRAAILTQTLPRRGATANDVLDRRHGDKGAGGRFQRDREGGGEWGIKASMSVMTSPRSRRLEDP